MPTAALLLAAVLAWPGGGGHPLEPADTSSPRSTLRSFLDNCNEVYATILAGERQSADGGVSESQLAANILRCLDLSQEPDYLRVYAGRRAAVFLKEVLDRIELPPFDDVPDAAGMHAAFEETGVWRWRLPHTEIEIARVTEGPRLGEYLFTPQTVARADLFYEEVEDLPYRTRGPAVTEGFVTWFLSEPRSPAIAAVVRALPDWMSARLGEQAAWQWTALVVVIVLAVTIMLVAYRLGRALARRAREGNVLRYWLTLLFPIVAMLVPLAVRDIVADELSISGLTLVVTRFTANVVFLLAFMVFLVSVTNRLAAIALSSPRIQPKGIDAQLVRLGFRVLGITAAVIVFLEGGRYLGIPLTTLLAGAGVGGLALALSAQDALKNLFGSMMIILDRPYRVGDRIVTKGYDGFVEEIGLRSTKIRLLTGHVASIPNERMAASDIENVSRRPHIRRVAEIPLALDTPPDKAERAVEIVRGILENHEGMHPDFPPRVHLSEIGRDSLTLRFFYWYRPPDYWQYLAFTESVNLRIKRELEAEGIRPALPATTTFMAPGERGAIEVKVVGAEGTDR